MNILICYPPGTVLSPFDRLHPDLDLCNEEQILQLTLVYLKLGWIETKYATFPAKNIVGRIAGAVLPKSKRRFWETLGNIGSFGGGCLLGANDRSAPLTDFGLIGTGNKSDDLAAGGFLITAISVSALAGDAFNVLKLNHYVSIQRHITGMVAFVPGYMFCDILF